jgi:hypothetical protein
MELAIETLHTVYRYAMHCSIDLWLRHVLEACARDWGREPIQRSDASEKDRLQFLQRSMMSDSTQQIEEENSDERELN